MTATIISNPARVWEYLQSHEVLVPAVSGMKGLGLERDGELIAGVLYEGYTGHNIWMHVATTPGKKWTMKFMRYCFYYPFIELGVRRVSGAVDASNLLARRFDEHLGFKQEAVLKSAARDGGDVILYRMFREECRHVQVAQN